MWRSLFLGLGLYLIILSAELGMVKEFSASWHKPETPVHETKDTSQSEWNMKVSRFMPYTALCLGVVVCIYSFQIPKLIKDAQGGDG